MKIILIDYGVGNLRSVQKALTSVGADVVQTDDPQRILSGDKVVLPGVGAFKDGMQGLQERGLIPIIDAVVARGTPLLGICLGMQLFLTSSSEKGETRGLGYINGKVQLFPANELKVPHTGWNQLQINQAQPLFRGVEDKAYVYFNHGYYCEPIDSSTVSARTDYGVIFASSLCVGAIYGVQFHPEKSQDIGRQILKNFVEVCG
jgi:glutamine amidotransferase